MDLTRLYEFTVIVKEASFSKAAEKLGVSLPVLSTRFKGFESALGTTLIERSARRFKLTRNGEILSRRAEDLLSGYDRALDSLKTVQGTEFQSLHIMLCAQLMGAELGPFLDVYCRQYPRLFLGLYDENKCRIREGLASGELNVVFAVGRPNDFEDIPGRVQINDFPKMKVHLPQDHPLANAGQIRFEQLAGETFILYPSMRETHTRDLQASMIQQAGIPYQIYEEDYSPFFFDLLVPIGKGIRLWNWSDRPTPNSAIVTIQDTGYETVLFMLYNPESENRATLHFTEKYLTFRRERK